MTYLDYAATTPVDPQVAECIFDTMTKFFGNPSSTYHLGKESKHLLLSSRQKIKDLLGLPKESQLYFTSGSTEAINWALMFQARKANELGLGNHIVASSIEHSAVREVLLALEKEGFEITWIDPQSDHQFLVDQFVDASNENTIGWTAMAVNNELGSVLPIQDLGQQAKHMGLWFHVDATQAVGYQKVDAENMPCTSFCASGHKFYAPKGIGFLVYQPWNDAMTLKPMILGGGQEYKMRSGTENIPYIVGLAKALELMLEDQRKSPNHYQILSQYFFDQLTKAGIEFEQNGDIIHHNHRVHNIWIKGHLASQMMIQLDLAGIYLSAGSACSAGSVKPSRILKAYYPENEALWRESLRVSFGRYTNEAQIDQLIMALKKI